MHDFIKQSPKEPDKDLVQVSKKDVDKLNIPRGSRMVLLRLDQHVVDERTESGIWKVSPTDTDWQKATHADRIGIVIKVPKSPLPFKVGANKMPWETRMELPTGAKVWYDFLAGENTTRFKDEDGKIYQLVPYDCCYVATFPAEVCTNLSFQKSTDGKDYIIPLNGFHIFERVYHEPKSSLELEVHRKVNKRMGIVKYVAKNNTMYENGKDEDHVELEVGDRVQFGTVPEVMLEDEAHCHFDGGRMYRRSQARNVDLVWRKGQLIIPRGRVLLDRIPDEEVTKAGIILQKPDVKNFRGKVLLSSTEGIRKGNTIKYIKGAGVDIDYKDKKVRLLKEPEVLYVE